MSSRGACAMSKRLGVEIILLQQLIKWAAVYASEHRSPRHGALGGRQHVHQISALAGGSGA